ncbi:unnamed protein product (macronuclear) [Paramecium tetraurelia]|uniref:F-BAR domain-containing protein n=1 Tax=Paramecium tetraurelia TaxID=5888 RepID=A0C836_PARTE|nr:uncharacterized protein GSPATT00036084001 [Paramecium tetraurelia]CAK66953.1 unnamed protein product [Paramecium tetraurelia]|eukprot:XP_001434350.1 hypothetical protein (macronuclear) [Paramecium tetraurelia strain d4-2]
MNQTQKLAYYPNLLGQSERIIQQNVESKRGLEEYLAILQERANIEDQYAKSLHRLSQQIDRSRYLTSYEYNSITYLREQLVNQLRQKIERLENFVDFIRSEIAEQVKEIILNQNQVQRKIIDEMKGLEWDLQDKQDDLMSGKLDYKLQARELEQSGIQDMIYQYSLDISEDKAIKQVSKTQQIQQECVKLERDFEIIVLSYNEFIDVYKTKMESYLSQMEQQEQQKLLVQKDTLMKLFLFESSISKQSLQDTEKLNDQIRKTNLQDVIENFIMKYQRPQEAPRILEFRPYSSFLSKTIESMRSQEYQKLKDVIKAHNDTFYNIYEDYVKKNNLQTIEEQELTHLISRNSVQAIYKIMQIHINCVWNANEIQNNETIVGLLRQSTQNRLLWCQALEIQANKSNYKVQSNDAYEQLIKWSQKIINLVLLMSYIECIEFLDASPLRKLITVSSLIHIAVQNKKHFLMYNIKDNKVLQTADFIEASVVQAVYDALVEEIKEVTTQEERIRKQKINILTQLSKICFTLLQFNPVSVIKIYAENYLKQLSVAQDATENLMFQIESFEQF